ncbi:methyl-accepting chemotaxis protein [Castellaniella defragrans]|uniref:Methyl-accepting chemotaxis protein n=1 Tax=Castellaniella defragrans TaxID=75697 RepID=A0A7W9TRA0_CASDE|nr:methyl-accepting chemotaxis protein [Castellaniella defragrans]MBB6084297.1 methyl-accepting chemotaxis protein [Castellaniella defragrans]
MTQRRTLRTSTRLICGFLIVSGIAALIGALGLYATRTVNQMAETMYRRDTVGLRDTAQANQQLLMNARAIRIAALAPTAEVRDAQLRAVRQHLDNLDANLARAAQAFTTPEERSLLAQATQASREYRKHILEVADILPTEPLQQARQSVGILYGQVVPTANRLDALMAQLIERRLAQAAALSEETASIYARMVWLILGLTLGGVALGLGIGLALTRGLSRVLGGEPQDVARVARAVAHGDLSTALDASRAHRDSVMRAMLHMQESLRGIVGTVRAGSDHIASGSEQIRLGNTDLAQRTERQAADITETAAAMDQISGTVSATAQAMRQAARFSTDASQAAADGGQRIESILQTMQGIQEVSHEVAGIVQVIDSIAFQTNILALNAAVEAARAGEQGRGFAVVAGEVRALAQKSALAAREITALIARSVERTDAGAREIEQASVEIRSLVDKIRQVAQLIDSADAATTEQTSGLGQINAAVSQLNDITQQNAALVQESAAAAASLSEQALQLLGVVRQFRMEKDMGPADLEHDGGGEDEGNGNGGVRPHPGPGTAHRPAAGTGRSLAARGIAPAGIPAPRPSGPGPASGYARSGSSPGPVPAPAHIAPRAQAAAEGIFRRARSPRPAPV